MSKIERKRRNVFFALGQIGHYILAATGWILSFRDYFQQILREKGDPKCRAVPDCVSRYFIRPI